MSFYQVKVQFLTTDLDSGKIKKQNVLYLVEDTGILEAENKISKSLIEDGETQFEIKAISESKISKVIE